MISIALIHPMLVHFPIVLLITGFAMDILLLSIKKDLTSRQCLPMVALAALLLGTLAAVVAAMFGDIAFDKAVSLGFPSAPIEIHETFALITITVFGLYCLWRLLALWRRYPLRGFTGWISILPGLAGVVLLIITAYHGGELVYHFGVNVATSLH